MYRCVVVSGVRGSAFALISSENEIVSGLNAGPNAASSPSSPWSSRTCRCGSPYGSRVNTRSVGTKLNVQHCSRFSRSIAAHTSFAGMRSCDGTSLTALRTSFESVKKISAPKLRFECCGFGSDGSRRPPL